MWTSNNKKYFLFLSIILFIGFISGLFFVSQINEASLEIILNNINEYLLNLGNLNLNHFLPHIFLFPLFLILAIFIIGVPLYLIFIFYNGFSLGFIISSLKNIFGFKGIIYGLIYIILSKGIFIFLLLILSIFLIRIGVKSFNYFFKKEGRMYKEEVFILLRKAMLIIIFILINDGILYFWGGKILNIFKFLLK